MSNQNSELTHGSLNHMENPYNNWAHSTWSKQISVRVCSMCGVFVHIAGGRSKKGMEKMTGRELLL